MDEGGNTLLTNWMYIYSLLTNLYSHLLVHSLSLIHCLLLVSQSVLELVQAPRGKTPATPGSSKLLGIEPGGRSTSRSHSHHAKRVHNSFYVIKSCRYYTEKSYFQWVVYSISLSNYVSSLLLFTLSHLFIHLFPV